MLVLINQNVPVIQGNSIEPQVGLLNITHFNQVTQRREYEYQILTRPEADLFECMPQCESANDDSEILELEFIFVEKNILIKIDSSCPIQN